MVSLEDARRVIAAAEKKSHEIGQPMNIAVVDEGGNLVAHVGWIELGLAALIFPRKRLTRRELSISRPRIWRLIRNGRAVLWNPRFQ